MKTDEKVIKALGYMQLEQNVTSFFSNYNDNDFFDNYFYDNISIKRLLLYVVRKICDCFRKKTKINYNYEITKVISYIKNKKSIVVFAPFFNRSKDGYIKRIEYIDKNILKDYTKIYLNCTGTAKTEFTISVIDNKHIYITFNSFNNEQLRCILKLIRTVKKTYTHSINMFMLDDVSYKLLYIFDDEKIYNIIDIHGAVPEETQMNYKNDRYLMASFVENYIFTRCKEVVCVSESMKTHYEKKYDLQNTIIIPIDNNGDVVDEKIIKEKKINEKPTIIYAGGLQSWQNIDLMNEIITKTVDMYNYEIYVTDVEEYCKKIDNITLSKITVDNLSQEQLIERYKKADFGFILRDKSVVNEVALPTKLIEYIKYGVVPIYKYENIGNFSKIRHIKYDDLLNKKLDFDISKAIQHNYKIYKSLRKIIKDSKYKRI